MNDVAVVELIHPLKYTFTSLPLCTRVVIIVVVSVTEFFVLLFLLPLVLSQPGLGPATGDLAAARLGLHGAKTRDRRRTRRNEHGEQTRRNQKHE